MNRDDDPFARPDLLPDEAVEGMANFAELAGDHESARLLRVALKERQRKQELKKTA
jgi:hypothetical protein